MAYDAKVTTAGLIKLASASIAEPLTITHMAVGDGNGGYPPIDPDSQSLANEVDRYELNSSEVQEPGTVRFPAVVPLDAAGPYTIRERGIIDQDGDLIAVVQMPAIEVPDPGQVPIPEITLDLYVTYGDATVMVGLVPATAFATKGELEAYATKAELEAYQKKPEYLEITGTSYTLTDADRDRVLYTTASAAVTVTIPDDIPEDWGCDFIQVGAGAITFQGEPGGALDIYPLDTRTTDGPTTGVAVRSLTSNVGVVLVGRLV